MSDAIRPPAAAPAPAATNLAARACIAATATFAALVAALHFVKPELDPSRRFISEYAIGDHGWMMQVAFLSLALGYVALALALRAQLRTIGGRVGAALLLVSAAGLILAGLFTTDPVTISPDAATAEGRLHGLGGTLGLAMPVAAALVTWQLRGRPAYSGARRAITWAAVAALAGFVLAVGSLAVMLSRSGGAFGPDVWVGWPNRLEVLGYCAWLLIVARHAARLPAPGGGAASGAGAG